MPISINPALMTNAAGGFQANSEGYIQGFALDDPAVRNALIAGIVAPGAAQPFWGGMAITEALPTAGTEADSVGSVLSLATAVANITGFTVNNQAAAMLQSAQSPAPMAPQGGGISFYRLGSGARIPVACSSGVAAALAGGNVNQVVYWDYANQVLLNAPGGGAIPVKVVGLDTKGNSQILVYNGGTGLATWNRAGYTAVIQI